MIHELASAASIFTYNALRSTNEERTRFLRGEFSQLKAWVKKGQYRFLVARERETGRSVGYLLLNLWGQDDLGRRQTVLEDMAMLPEYGRRGAGLGLVEAATRITAELGLDFMAAEVSATNPIYDAALRKSFELEAYKIVRPCTPEAVARLAQLKEARETQQRIEEQVARRQEARKKRREG